ncbi:MAG: succinate dehydrogenase [Bacteroidales bacterium]|nr:succinate dehydrogenase [Bacteroidales bacterium]
MSNIFTSSIGKKLMMSLAGLFLLAFLLLHLAINITLILYKDTETFNRAATFMGTNPVIKVMEVILFGGFLLHMVYGAVLQVGNLMARPKGYKKANYSQTSFFSKYMLHTALIITIFLVLHLFDFWVKNKFLGSVHEITYADGETYHNLGALVLERFKIGWVVVVYVVLLLGLGFHLHHGFQSAFQTLGINHKSYTPVIKTLGVLYSVVVTTGYISIPVYIYFFK